MGIRLFLILILVNSIQASAQKFELDSIDEGDLGGPAQITSIPESFDINLFNEVAPRVDADTMLEAPEVLRAPAAHKAAKAASKSAPSKRIPASEETGKTQTDLGLPKPSEPTNYELGLSIKDLSVTDGISKKDVVKYILNRISKLQTCFPRAVPLEKIDTPVKVHVGIGRDEEINSVVIKSSLPFQGRTAACLRKFLGGQIASSNKGGKFEFELNLME